MRINLYSIDQICTVVKGRWLQHAGSVSIAYLLPDTRKLLFPASSLFFALKGPRRNGHAFLPEAYAKGIRNFIVDTETMEWLPGPANVILVDDALAALQAIAAWHRERFTIPVIGITGSNGKTIVKEWLNQLLEDQFAIVRSPRSYNSQTGVPLSVWQISDHHTLGIFEAGISLPGEMDRLERIIRPDIGIITNIGEAHSEGFVNKQQKALEKLQLFAHADTVIYRSDYPEINEGLAALQVQRAGSKQPLELFSWGKGAGNTLQIKALQAVEESTVVHARYQGADWTFTLPFSDEASIENAVTCCCTLLLLGLDTSSIQRRIAALAPMAMRLELKKGINDCSIINDSYSADLGSLRIALDFLARQQQHPRKTVILSDIPESGQPAAELYAAVAAALAEKHIDRLIGIGPQITGSSAQFAAVPGLESFFFPGIESFRKDFHQLKFQHETILLKGARAFEFEQLLPLLEQQVHQTVLEINLGSILHNLRQYQQVLQPSTKVMAMVKASSYGSGSFEVASLLQFHKADYLAVAYADEGVELRKGGISMPIMVMNPEPGTFEALVQYNLEPDIYSFGLLDAFEDHLRKEGLQQYPVHIELETGMNRLGFDAADADKLGAALAKSRCKVQSVFTHLAASEDPASQDFTQQQADKYFAAVALMEKLLPYNFLRHMANSAAILRYPPLQLDMVRLGIGLYGIDSANTHRLDLQEVSTLKTTVAQVKHLKKGETAGYGRRGIAVRDSIIATVRLGYADGYPRTLSYGVGKMLVNGQLAPVIGTVCMDMTMLDVTDAGPVSEGDEVIVFGPSLSVQQVAEWAGSIPYEIMTGISQRVKRVYFEE